MKTLSADMGGSRVKLATVENGTVMESEMFTVSSEGFSMRLRSMCGRTPGRRGARFVSSWPTTPKRLSYLVFMR